MCEKKNIITQIETIIRLKKTYLNNFMISKKRNEAIKILSKNTMNKNIIMKKLLERTPINKIKDLNQYVGRHHIK